MFRGMLRAFKGTSKTGVCTDVSAQGKLFAISLYTRPTAYILARKYWRMGNSDGLLCGSEIFFHGAFLQEYVQPPLCTLPLPRIQ